MAFNGSGTFNRTNGTNSGSTTWQQDRDEPVNILANRHDTHDQDLADGLTNCVTKDGQTTVTANLPMATFKHTNVGSATTRTDYTRADDLQDNKLNWGGDAGGSSNAYTLTLSPPITSYTDGMRVGFIPNHINTGSATLNINSVGAKAITYADDGDNVLRADLQTGRVVEVIYDSTTDKFQYQGGHRREFISVTTTEESNQSSSKFDIFADANYPGTLDSTTHQSQNITFTSSDGRFTITDGGIYMIAITLITGDGGGSATATFTADDTGGGNFFSSTISNNANIQIAHSFTLLKEVAAGAAFNFFIDGTTVSAGVGTTCSITKI